ncbi:MAG: NADH-quinone oxidoreductase subunit J [Bacteroidota bacterium]|nr:NADH-quinone oxidoreductase subunit J [Bacteroidota bacterium]
MRIDIIFYILTALTIISATLVVTTRHPIRSVLFLVLTFFFISAHYILMNAQFLALVNVVVYAGAIMVLFLFVIMYLNLNRDMEKNISIIPLFAATISGGCLFLIIVAALDQSDFSNFENNASYSTGLIENLGMTLYKDYLLPLELSSILFIVAMIGIVLLNRKNKIDISKTNLS